MSYIKDGAEIYRRSFALIRSEADLGRFDAVLERVVVRMIHASGMVDLAADIEASAGFGDAGERALKDGGAILCDTNMVASGVTRARLPAANDVVCTLSDRRSRSSPPTSGRRARRPPSSCGGTSCRAPSS
jgi:precorrin isomerase